MHVSVIRDRVPSASRYCTRASSNASGRREFPRNRYAILRRSADTVRRTKIARPPHRIVGPPTSNFKRLMEIDRVRIHKIALIRKRARRNVQKPSQLTDRALPIAATPCTFRPTRCSLRTPQDASQLSRAIHPLLPQFVPSSCNPRQPRYVAFSPRVKFAPSRVAPQARFLLLEHDNP